MNLQIYYLELVVFLMAVVNLFDELKFWVPPINQFITAKEKVSDEIRLCINLIFLLFPIFAAICISPWFLVIYIVDAVHNSNKDAWSKSKIYKHLDISFCVAMYLTAIVYLIAKHLSLLKLAS